MDGWGKVVRGGRGEGRRGGGEGRGERWVVVGGAVMDGGVLYSESGDKRNTNALCAGETATCLLPASSRQTDNLTD